MNIKILLVVLIGVLVVGGVSAATPISNCQELQNINNNLAEDYYLTQDIDCSDTVNWNSGAGFNPIGPSFFTGTLDGKGHTIRDLYEYRPSDYGGLFVFGRGAIIKNVNLENVFINGGQQVGAVISYISEDASSSHTLIDNVHVTGSVTGTITQKMGGLVGYMGGTGPLYPRIINSSFVGSVIGFGGPNIYVGGLVGEISVGEVINSYFAGAVFSNQSRVGGIVGFNHYGTITRCYSKGDVEGNGEVGGLVGLNWGSSFNPISNIIDCYSTASVSGNNWIGGLVGHNFETCSITNSYAAGAVTGISGVGGLVGKGGGSCPCYSSFWDMEEGYSTSDCLSPGGETGKTTAEMKSQSTFNPPWDFTSIWQVYEGIDYPYLKWQTISYLEPGMEKVCGNDIIEMGEECDDSNTFDDDGCSSTCQYETCSANGLVGYWKLDNSLGYIHDYSGKGNEGIPPISEMIDDMANVDDWSWFANLYASGTKTTDGNVLDMSVTINEVGNEYMVLQKRMASFRPEGDKRYIAIRYKMDQEGVDHFFMSLWPTTTTFCFDNIGWQPRHFLPVSTEWRTELIDVQSLINGQCIGGYTGQYVNATKLLINDNNGASSTSTTGHLYVDYISFVDANYVNGKVKEGVEFDGVDDYVEVADDISLDFGIGEISYCLWFNQTVAGEVQQLLAKRDSSAGNYEVQVNGNKIEVAFGNGVETSITRLYSSTILSPNNWYYVCVVRDSGELKLYVNGNNEDSKIDTDNIDSISNLYIGNDPYVAEYFNGLIDEVAIYNRALSEAEIKAQYNNGLGKYICAPAVCGNGFVETGEECDDGNTFDDDGCSATCQYETCSANGLVGYWKFDNSLGYTHDYSGNNNDGINNGVSFVDGKVGQAGSFDGSSSHIDTGNTFVDTLRGSFSVCLWFKANHFSDFTTLIGASNLQVNTDNLMQLSIREGTLLPQFAYKVPPWLSMMTAAQSQDYVFETDKWYYYCGVADSSANGLGGMKIYVNGAEAIPYTSLMDGDSNGVNFTKYSNSQNIFIGARDTEGVVDRPFNGLIDEVAVYNRTLSQNEILVQYNNGLGKYICGIGPEICNDNIDNNNNALTDCNDPLCSGYLLCQSGKSRIINKMEQDKTAVNINVSVQHLNVNVWEDIYVQALPSKNFGLFQNGQNPLSIISLNTLFSGWNSTGATPGKYRIYAAVVNQSGALTRNKDGSYAEGWYNFDLVP